VAEAEVAGVEVLLLSLSLMIRDYLPPFLLPPYSLPLEWPVRRETAAEAILSFAAVPVAVEAVAVAAVAAVAAESAVAAAKMALM
jgi:hypothetical protein